MTPGSSPLRRLSGWLAVAAIAGIVPPILLPAYTLNTFVLFFVWAMVAQSWNLIWGVAGVWSLGQVAIFAVSGYATGLLILHTGLPAPVSVVCGVFAALVMSGVMALPTLRLKGVYVILVTISFHELVRILLTTDTSGFTGGAFGLPSFPGLISAEVPYDQRMLFQYAIGFFLLVGVTLGHWMLLRSHLGLAIRTIGQDPVYAASRGVSFARTQVAAFLSAGLMAGIAGAYYAQYFGTIQPGILRYDVMVMVLAMLAIGGWGSFAGPIVGAFALVWLGELLQEAQQFRMVTFGALIVLFAVVFPQGIGPLLARALGTLRSAAMRLAARQDDLRS